MEQSFSIQTILNNNIQKKEEREMSDYWYASDLGKCLCGVYWRRKLKEPAIKDLHGLRVMHAGKTYEESVVNLLKKDLTGYEIETQGLVQDEDLRIKGYYDLLITKQEIKKSLLYEIKTVHSYKFDWLKKEGIDPHYRQQLWIYLYMKKISEGRLLYVDRDNFLFEEFPVFLEDKDLEQEVMRQLDVLNTAWKNDKPPEPEPLYVNEKPNWKARYCDYHWRCLGVSKEEWEKTKEQLKKTSYNYKKKKL